MNQPGAVYKRSTVILGLVAALTIASVGSGLWFLRAPAQSPLSQQQLSALATRAARDMASAVKKTIHRHALEIQKPWLAYLATKPATTEGSIALEWTIAPDGKPTQVAVVHSDFDQVAFNEGVRDALAGIAFAPPPSGLPHHVTHKLVFKREPEGLATPTPPTPNVK